MTTTTDRHHALVRGRRYDKLVSVDGSSRSAVGFYDRTTGLWLEAESWSRPRPCRRRLPASLVAIGDFLREAPADEAAPPVLPVSTDLGDRDVAITEIRSALRRRSGKAWSVRGGGGTAWGWITVTAPPSRLDRYGALSDADRAELAALLGVDVHHQGVLVPAGSDWRREYVARARGEEPTVYGKVYWD